MPKKIYRLSFRIDDIDKENIKKIVNWFEINKYPLQIKESEAVRIALKLTAESLKVEI